MSDIEIGVTGQNAPVTAPSISEGGLTFMRSLLNDPAWVAAYPSQCAALRQSLETGTKVTGQTADAEQDQRTATQQRHDKIMGIEERPASVYTLEAPDGYTPPEGKTTADTLGAARDLCAALQLDPVLAKAVVRDLLSVKETPNPVTVAATVRDYGEAMRFAKLALEHAARRFKGEVPKAEQLPPYSLSMLAIQGRQIEQWRKTRPQ